MTAEEVIKAVDNIPTFVTGDDIRLYHKYASGLPDGSLIFDAGTGMAKSAISLALSSPNSKVITVDNGVYPVKREWVKSQDVYVEKILEDIRRYNASNVSFECIDLMDYFPDYPIDLFHIDAEVGFEGPVLEKFYPHIKSGGLILIRNYNRFKEEVDRICGECEVLESGGMIHVFKKI